MSITLYGLIFPLGIIGNGLVIWIAGFKMKKTISAVWFLHLAIADFLCCASLALRIVWELCFISYLPYCISILIVFAMNMSASVLFLTAMSIDRCVSVMWPFWAKVHRTRRLVRITAGGIWVMSLLLSCFVLFSNGWCISRKYHDDSNVKQTTWVIRLVIMFVIPFLIILTSYVIIFLKLRRSKRPQRSQRPYRIITAVILVFFICWSPYYIWPLTPTYNRKNIQRYIIHTIVYILAYLNSCLNPIIYVFMGQDTKAGFLRSIFTRLRRALTEHPDDLSREQEDGDNTHSTDV
ncbi:C3a anaphylatoxin chemotactic receptor-like [Leptodactylus fuscus]|uniref:C3a anaphylatoxin chemotactic receptor-like n=1 Tax=Leptodactylus fuscus TaxID=238119 RepID=UPI003F4F3888